TAHADQAGSLRPRRDDGRDAARSAGAAVPGHDRMTLGNRSSLWSLALLANSLVGLGWAALTTSPPRLVYNASDSVPVGWYRISPATSLVPGDLVLVHLPPAVRSLAAQRGYLPANVPLLKTVAAMAPQQVCVVGNQV